MTWAGAMVDTLARLRLNGVERFDVAWRMALEVWPPSLRDQRPTADRTALFDVELLEAGEQPEETMVEFTRRVCEDAWTGRRPVLGKLMGALDSTFMEEESGASSFRQHGRGVQAGTIV